MIMSSTIIEFGNGDIIVSSGVDEDDTVSLVRFVGSAQSHDIMKDLMDWDVQEVGHEVILVFNNPKSIDVVINALNKAKENIYKRQGKETMNEDLD